MSLYRTRRRDRPSKRVESTNKIRNVYDLSVLDSNNKEPCVRCLEGELVEVKLRRTID